MLLVKQHIFYFRGRLGKTDERSKPIISTEKVMEKDNGKIHLNKTMEREQKKIKKTLRKNTSFK